MTQLTYHVFRDKKGEYRWHAKAANGEIVATSGGDGYKNRQECLDALRAVKTSHDAEIVFEPDLPEDCGE